MNARQNKSKRKKPTELPAVDPAATDNLLGFFGLLLEIDNWDGTDFLAWVFDRGEWSEVTMDFTE